MGHLVLGAGDLGLCGDQVSHASGTVLSFGGTLAQKCSLSPQTDYLLVGKQWLLWEYLGSPDLALGIRGGFLEEVMAKVKPEGDTGFMLVRLGKVNSRQMRQVRDNITEELGVSWVRRGFSTCEGVMRVGLEKWAGVDGA